MKPLNLRAQDRKFKVSGIKMRKSRFSFVHF